MKRSSLVVCGVLLSLTSTSIAVAQEQPQAEEKPAKKDQDMELRLNLRGGFTANVALADPNFYGIGGMAEPTIGFNDRFGVGLRIDGMALFGVGIGDDVQAGIRVLAGILPKVEFKLWRGPVQPFLGLAGGYYTVAIAGASVSANNEAGALVGGGQALGVAPQVGIEFGSFRIAALSHLVVAGELEPVFSLELSGNTFSLGF